MAALNIQTLKDTGVVPTLSPANATDTVPVGNGHDTFLVLESTDTAAKVITVSVPGGKNAYGEDWPAKIINIAAGNTTPQRVWLPLRREYANPDTGRATITVTTGGATNLKSAVVQVG